MPVPASYNDITTDKELRDHVGWVWYETDAVIPRAWTKDQRIVIRFGSVTQHAVVYLNGEEIARHKVDSFHLRQILQTRYMRERIV